MFEQVDLLDRHLEMLAEYQQELDREWGGTKRAIVTNAGTPAVSFDWEWADGQPPDNS